MLLTSRFEDIADPALLKERWRALEEQAGSASFFLSWTWIGSWLDALKTAGVTLPQLLVIEGEGHDVALALLGSGRSSRRFGSVPALWLNEAGHADGDRSFIEYNGLLCRNGMEMAAARAFTNLLRQRRDWRVLYLSGLESSSPLPLMPEIRRSVSRGVSPVYMVDLGAVRFANGDYLSLLGANTRSQIRRSLKDEAAELSIDIARDEVTIGQQLSEMQRLNARRHKDNAWDGAFFRDFVRRISLAGRVDGSVELLHVLSGKRTLGYLLNFLWKGNVMNYQSAFVQAQTAKSKPGLMCHAAAIGHYAARDLAHYSLLAGGDRYKQSLSTHAEQLHWWALERLDWRLEAEALARTLLRR